MSDLSAPVALAAEHDLTAFDCGKAPLDEFLKRHARDKQRAMLSRSYVVTRGNTVLAYYTLAHVSVQRPEVPTAFGRGMPDANPAMLMARFAVDRTMQGRGLGRSLLTDALRRTWAAMESGPAPMRLFLVDAKDEEARHFYERFDMQPSPLTPLRLFLSYKAIRALFTA